MITCVRREHSVDGPIREYFRIGSYETPDEAVWRTEVGGPIFNTGERFNS